MPLDVTEIDKAVECLMRRRDSVSLRAARVIRGLQSEIPLAYAKGWDAALKAAIREVS